MKTHFTRRQFSTTSLSSAAAIAIGASAPHGWMQSLAGAIADEPSKERILVVIQMSGGNDGLNTIIPIADERYAKARPKLAIPKSDAISLNAETALHPSMRGIASLIEEKKFSVIHGIGYPNPNRSHFESMDIWHSCQRKDARSNDGWLGRLFSTNADQRSDSRGMHLGSEPMPLALVGRGVQTPSIATVDQFRWKGKTDGMQETLLAEMKEANDKQEQDGGLLDFVSASTSAAMQASDRLEKALSSPDKAGDFPDSQLGEKLKVISRLILAGLQTQVYYVTLDGFDTHANQLAAHAGLMKQWSEALQAFHRRLDSAGQGDRVLVLSFSEFGRRVSENASQGTDHGAAAPAFVSGPQFANTFIGAQPDLGDLDDGDLKFKVDFRSVYATLIEDWLGLPSNQILAGDFAKIDELKLAKNA